MWRRHSCLRVAEGDTSREVQNSYSRGVEKWRLC